MKTDLKKRKEIIQIIKDTLKKRNYNEEKLKEQFPSYLNESVNNSLENIPNFLQRIILGTSIQQKLNENGLWDWYKLSWQCKEVKKINKNLWKWEK